MLPKCAFHSHQCFQIVNNATVIARYRVPGATKIVKIWIPGKKFCKSGVITYEDSSSQVSARSPVGPHSGECAPGEKNAYT
jgi:hypothetical protein